jgi:serine/threonine protein phosphatase PrpC
MSDSPEIIIAARTHVGKVRGHNEDDFLVCRSLDSGEWFFDGNSVKVGNKGSLFAVADGMGGENAGEIASRIAMETLQRHFSQLDDREYSDRQACDLLEKIILSANDAVIQNAASNIEHARMGTTIVIAWLQTNRVHIAWIGDSRCYLLRNQNLILVTDDHSPVWEMVRKGKLSVEEAHSHPDKNLISQHLGQKNDPLKPDTKTLILEPGDTLLVCSDGLNGMLTDKQIESNLNRNNNLNFACEQLVEAANIAGGYDNITAILVKIKDLNGEGVATTVINEGMKTSTLDGTELLRSNKPLKQKGNFGKLLLFLFALVLTAIGLYYWYDSRLKGDGERSEIPPVENTTPPFSDTNNNTQDPQSLIQENEMMLSEQNLQQELSKRKIEIVNRNSKNLTPKSDKYNANLTKEIIGKLKEIIIKKEELLNKINNALEKEANNNIKLKLSELEKRRFKFIDEVNKLGVLKDNIPVGVQPGNKDAQLAKAKSLLIELQNIENQFNALYPPKPTELLPETKDADKNSDTDDIVEEKPDSTINPKSPEPLEKPKK